MSLQVWLPLNGNLNNQGLSDITVTNNGATVDNSGKIGKCYKCSGDARISFQSFSWMTMKPQNNFSFFFWAKGTTTGWLFACSAWEFRLTPTYIQIHLAGNGQYPARYNGSFDTNTWYHLGFTWSGSDGKLLLYLNGSKVAESDVPSSANFDIASTFNLPYDGPRYLNDVRIYDHCLSKKEVKEISKGLVLHYPLNDGYLENTTNINSFIEQGIDNSCYNGATGKYNYGTNTDMYKVIGEFQNKKCTKVYMGTANQKAYPYVYFSPLHPSKGVYKTLSFDYYPTSQNRIIFYTYNGTATLTSTVNGAVINSSEMLVNLNEWNHITVTLYGTSDATNGWGYMRIGTAAHTSTTTDYWLFANVQIEEKDHATPYTDSSRNETVIYDCSGFNYNGTKTGDLLASYGSPRYEQCCNFDESSYITSSFNSDIIKTVSFWIYPKNTNNGIYFIDTGSKLGFGFYNNNILVSCNGFRIPVYSNSNIILNTWNYIVLIKTDSSVDMYVNTHKKTALNSTNYWNSSTQEFRINGRAAGDKNTSFIMSDFRAYATALSAEDIKELYNAPISISKNQILLTQGELIENTSSKELMKSFGEIVKYSGASDTTVTSNSIDYSLELKGQCWATDGEFIEIDCTKTFYYDIIYSNTAGSQIYLGFEKYDSNKTSTSNNSCVYVLNSSAAANNKRIFGTVNLAKDSAGSDTKYIKLRILNSWNARNTANIASFKLISLRQVNTIKNPDFNKNGIVSVDSFREYENMSLYKNGFIETNKIIEY